MDDEFAQLLEGPFRISDALDIGLTKGQLRSKKFANPFHGVYASAKLRDDLCTRCMAAALVLPHEAVFSHSTAAALWLLPTPTRETAVEVSVPAGVTVPHRRGIKSHERKVLQVDTTKVFGVRVTTPAAVFVDLAERFDRAQLTALGDAILRRRLETRAGLEAAVNRAARRRGVRLARRTVSTLDARAESPMESYLRALLLQAGLPAPEVNPNLYDTEGNFLARVDLLFRQARVIVEYDGDHHRTDKQQFAADLARTATLTRHGYIVLRFTAVHLFCRPAWLIETVRAALAARA